MSSPDIALQRSYQTPSPVSSLAFGDGGHLFAGSGALEVLTRPASFPLTADCCRRWIHAHLPC
jgi:hypothetical protein